jgi:DNA topoisomerase-1
MSPQVRRLILAEKFSAARRLVQILSEGMAEKVRAEGFSYFQFSKDGDVFIVFPLRGHVVEIDYPEELRDWKTTDLDLLIDAEPARHETPVALHDTLRSLADGLDEVILATDYDREGELIGVEALETLRSRKAFLPARRARFSAMTPSEVRRAFENLVEPDWALAEAAAARQKIDLAWGAVLTRFLTIECASGRQILSAGRVQTPTLRLVADREREREDFVPRPFWNVLLIAGMPPFEATAVGGPFWDAEAAKAIVALAGLGAESAAVERIDHREHQEPPPAPFNTTSLLAQASREGIRSSRAMLAAQDLYVRGEISYPRTDNTVYPATLPVRDFLERLRDSPFGEYAARLLNKPVLEASRGPIQTTDHPPIHPTSAPSKRKAEVRSRVYEIIARRFLATLSPANVSTVTEVHLCIGDTRFLATGRTVLEPGWREILPDPEPVADLPPLQVGEAIPVHEIRIVEGRTKGPYLYSQGSLLLTMQRLGLGTKSTRHEILDLLFRRQYVSGRSIRTTAAGRALIDAMAIHGPRLASPEMTGHLEDRMTAIAEGRATLDEVVTESRQALRGVLGQLQAHRSSLSRWLRDATFLEKDYGPCDACGTGRLVRRRARNGWAFLGCTAYPACKRRMRLNAVGQRLPWAERGLPIGSEAVEASPTA